MDNNGSAKPLAVVTGASRGIGYELAKQFAQNGFDLVIAADSDAVNEATRVCKRWARLSRASRQT